MWRRIAESFAKKRKSFLSVFAWIAMALPASGQALFPFETPESPPAAAKTLDLVLLADAPVARPLEQGTPELIADPGDGKPCFAVRTKQAGMRIDEPAFVTPATTLSWSWKKKEGKVCIVQVGLKNPETGQFRYLGYAAGHASPPCAWPPNPWD